MSEHGLIGRQRELAWLGEAVKAALAGRGSFVLLAGEAGVGKTHLAEAALSGAPVLLRGAAQSPAATAYGPVVAALRSRLRRDPAALDAVGPLRAHLAVLLPELGPAAETSDRATVFEAVRHALETLAPAFVLLDDLQWCDGATLELLAALAAPLRELPMLIVGSYRSDELGRGSPLRRLRADLRRARLLRELIVAPLDAGASALLAARELGAAPSPQLADALYDRTQGVPFFLQELAAALEAGGRVRPGPNGLELSHGEEVPVPETVRDAVLLRTGGLSPLARAGAEAAAVAGSEFPLDLAPGVDELIDAGLVVETEPGRGAFRHSLVRGAIYEDIPWLRCRQLHASLAQRLEHSGASSAEIAAHWRAAGEPERALDAYLDAAHELAEIHAHRDAAAAALEALNLWPEGSRPDERLGALDDYAHYAELAGDLAEAIRALKEAIGGSAGVSRGTAERRLATLYELQGDRERALVARTAAADAFVEADLPGEAAAERLRLAAYGQSAGRHAEAVELAAAAAVEATLADRMDLRARALGLEGVARAKRGDYEMGVETIRAGLSLALEHELTTDAAELYQRLATALEQSADYDGARTALGSAVSLCEMTGASGQEHTCLSCMAYVLRELGDWDQSAEVCRELGAGTDRPDDALVADGVLGSILAFRGDARGARPLLERCAATTLRLDVVSMGVDSAAALGWIDLYAGGFGTEHFQGVLERWERSEDHHYAVWGLRVAAQAFATAGDVPRARACSEALSAIVATTGHSDALSALAHALGETALAEGDADAAAHQMSRALALQSELEIPFERAQISLRAGVALAAAGDRDAGLARLEDAYRCARKLGSKPLSSAAAGEFARLDEPLAPRLGRRAEAEHEAAGLSRRELEVMRLVSVGRTNREIAHELFLSPRTVDMHVRNILLKLSCRTRTEAATRAAELGLLA